MATPEDIDVSFDADQDRLELNLERNFRAVKTILADHFDESIAVGETRFLLYDVDNGQFERVTVGVANSGGAGFKLLRIPN